MLQLDSLAAANGKEALSNDALLAFVVTALEKFKDAGMPSVDPLLVLSFFEEPYAEIRENGHVLGS